MDPTPAVGLVAPHVEAEPALVPGHGPHLVVALTPFPLTASPPLCGQWVSPHLAGLPLPSDVAQLHLASDAKAAHLHQVVSMGSEGVAEVEDEGVDTEGTGCHFNTASSMMDGDLLVANLPRACLRKNTQGRLTITSHLLAYINVNLNHSLPCLLLRHSENDQ